MKMLERHRLAWIELRNVRMIPLQELLSILSPIGFQPSDERDSSAAVAEFVRIPWRRAVGILTNSATLGYPAAQ
jgi:hypothetical protein